MPEIAVDKHRESLPWEYDIGFTWQMFDVLPEPQTFHVQPTSDDPLYICVLLSNTRHPEAGSASWFLAAHGS